MILIATAPYRYTILLDTQYCCIFRLLLMMIIIFWYILLKSLLVRELHTFAPFSLYCPSTPFCHSRPAAPCCLCPWVMHTCTQVL